MKLSPSQFKELLQKMSGTSYIPAAVRKAISDKGYSEYLSYSCSSEKAISIVKELQKEGVLSSSSSPAAVIKQLT